MRAGRSPSASNSTPQMWSGAVEVVHKRTLARGYFVLRLSPCPALTEAQPGQFVMLRGAWQRDPLLPRAFSLLRVLPDGESEVLIKAIGRGTRLLELLDAGDSLQLLGPLGRPFSVESGAVTLVAGGVGLAPLLWYAECNRSDRTPKHVLIYGARSAADLVLLDEIKAAGCDLVITTEDGTAGDKGRVTDALIPRLSANTVVLTCGPNAMMVRVAELSEAAGARCMVSVEGEMACGIGACLGCAVPMKEGTRPFLYACVDGPVFNSRHIKLPGSGGG